MDLIAMPRELLPGGHVRATDTLVAIQVKSGVSQVQPGDTGWWVREGELLRWARRPYPFLLVIWDEHSGAPYWEQVQADRLIQAGSGWKIHIPRSQRVDEASRDALLGAAMSASGRQLLSRFNPPQRQRLCRAAWRAALLTPWTVAPHPNQGAKRPIGAIEAAALVMLGHEEEWARFAAEHRSSVPFPHHAADHMAWHWRFVDALLAMRDRETRAASVVTGLTAHAPAHGLVVIRVLDAVLGHRGVEGARAVERVPQRLDLLDRIWLALHRAEQARLEGDLDMAAQLARSAWQALGPGQDVVGAVLRRSAAAFLWWLNDVDDVRLEDSFKAEGIEPSYWQAQHWAGVAQAMLADRIAGEGRSRPSFDPPAEERLRTVAFQDEVAADRGARHARAHEGRAVPGPIAGPRALPAEAGRRLELLMAAGDEDGLAAVVTQLWQAGPAKLLKGAISALAQRPAWDPDRARSTLAMFEHAGDFLTQREADGVVAELLAILRDPNHLVRRQGGGGWSVEIYVASAVAGVMPAASRTAHAAVAAEARRWLTHDSPGVIRLPSVVGACDPARVSQREWRGLLEMALAHRGRHPNVCVAVMERYLATGKRTAEEEIRRVWAEDEDLEAALALFGHNQDPQIAAWLVTRLSQALRDQRDPGPRLHSFRSLEVTLSDLNLRVPTVAAWEPVFDFVLSRNAQLNKKLQVLWLVACRLDRLPPAARAELGRGVRSLGSSDDVWADDVARRRLSKLASVIAARLTDDVAILDASSSLASDHDPYLRSLAAQLLSGNRHRSGALLSTVLTLTGDSDHDVAAHAIETAATLVSTPDSAGVLQEVVERALKADGAAPPLAAINGLHKGGTLDAFRTSVGEVARRHASATVRCAAAGSLAR